jgi:GT2 family glycosyltransferase
MTEIRMEKKARIGVIIVNYNSGGLLEQCIEGLMKQEFRDFLTLIVDNASSDDSLAAIRERFQDVIIVDAGSNLGFASANNLAFQVLNDNVEWFALLNPDACPSPGWLKALDKAAQAYPEYDSFGSRLYSGDSTGLLDGVGDEYHISGMVWRKAHGYPDKAAYNMNKEIFSPCAAAAMYSKKAITEAGGFDGDFFCYLEDVDLGFRMRLLGRRSMYVHDATVFHKGSAISGMRSAFYIYYGQRNIVWTYYKNMPLPLLLFFLPLHIAVNLLSVIKYTVLGKAQVIFRAKADAVAGMSSLAKKRKKAQSDRRISLTELLRMMRFGICRS